MPYKNEEKERLVVKPQDFLSSLLLKQGRYYVMAPSMAVQARTCFMAASETAG